MKYLRSLLYNFFIVFFANYLIQGVDVVDQTKLPHIGGDLMFALGLGFLNSIVLPLLKMFVRSVGILQLSVLSLVLNFGAYALLKVLSIGVYVTNVKGYLIAATIVSVGSFILSMMRRVMPANTRSSHDEDEFVTHGSRSPHDEE